jgi:N-acetylglucosamine-6-phosphate deacetylase
MTLNTGLDPHSGLPVTVRAEGELVTRVEQSSHDGDLFISPGFVDLQVNGYAGIDLNGDDLATDLVRRLLDRLLAEGVTCFAPTLITAPQDELCHALSVIAAARRQDPLVAACIPFVHVEGPHISPQDGYRGAHPADAVRAPSVTEFDSWQRASDGLVGLVTMSPHWSGSEEYIQALTQQGVHVALGHTDATPEQIVRAVDAGARLSTHLGNGVPQQVGRHNNPIWPQLADDRLTATFIGDSHHLPASVLKPMLRAKGLHRSILVSDSVALAGLPAGVYTTPVGGQVELKPDGKLCVFGSELLAGSTTSLAACIGSVVRLTGLSLHDVLPMATANPGRFVGGRGLLTPGSRADLVRFRWQDHQVLVEDVWLGGEHVFGRRTGVRG